MKNLMMKSRKEPLWDYLRRENILERIQKGNTPLSSGDDVLAQIEKLSKLKDAGVLSEEEFATKKADLLAKI